MKRILCLYCGYYFDLPLVIAVSPPAGMCGHWLCAWTAYAYWPEKNELAMRAVFQGLGVDLVGAGD